MYFLCPTSIARSWLVVDWDAGIPPFHPAIHELAAQPLTILPCANCSFFLFLGFMFSILHLDVPGLLLILSSCLYSLDGGSTSRLRRSGVQEVEQGTVCWKWHQNRKFFVFV